MAATRFASLSPVLHASPGGGGAHSAPARRDSRALVGRRLEEVYDAVETLTHFLNTQAVTDERSRTLREAVYGTLAGELLHLNALEAALAELTGKMAGTEGRASRCG